jgi:hypothetical protein
VHHFGKGLNCTFYVVEFRELSLDVIKTFGVSAGVFFSCVDGSRLILNRSC